MVSVEPGAFPTGLEGFTSSKGALLLATGEGFGSGPSRESGVGDGAGLTRRGRDDCAWAGKTLTATITNASMLRANNDDRIGVTFRLIITGDSFRVILSDLYQRFNETGRVRGVYSDAFAEREVCQKRGKEKSGRLRKPTAPGSP